MTPEATAYFNEVMDIIEHNALKREQINWQVWRSEMFEMVRDARIPADTYGAIEATLQRLNDHHSMFSAPAQVQERLLGTIRHAGLRVLAPSGFVVVVYAGSPAHQAGIQVGDRILLLNGAPPQQMIREAQLRAFQEEHLDLVIQPKGQKNTSQVSLQTALYNTRRLPQGQRLAQNIGYLDLSELPDSPEHNQLYMAEAHKLLQEIDDPPVCGWVLDLRRNFGGNLWPMLVSAGPLLGDAEWLAFYSPSQQIIAFYREGKAGTDTRGVVAQVEHPYHLKRAQPPVAVLTSQATISSGEFVTLAFRGRTHSRSFGDPTYGVPTANYLYELSDGAQLALTVRLGVDRTGQTYDSPLVPDQQIKVDWTQVGTTEDPVLQAALQWLHDDGCL